MKRSLSRATGRDTLRSRRPQEGRRALFPQFIAGLQPMSSNSGRVIVSVIGRDRVGIIAAVSAVLADTKANILDISQTVMEEFFVMIMMVDISETSVSFADLKLRLQTRGEELGVKIDAQHEDVFNYMHRI
jgi:ACT domain-containing protein